MISHKTLCVFVSIPVLLVGGTEIQTINLVKVLTKCGYHVVVCCYYKYEHCIVFELKSAGAKVILMDLERTGGLFHLLKNLTRMFVEHRPDIVHQQYIAPGLIPILAARLAGVRTVFATVHQPGRTYGVKARLMLRTAARLCTAFFCNSLSVERSWFGDCALFCLDKVGARKHWTIYNSVDCEYIATVAEKANKLALRTALELGDVPVVGGVGRFRGEKGQTVLIEAMAEVIKQAPDAVLLLVGDGPDRAMLEQKAASLGVADNVVWTGQRSADEVYRLYAIMDVVAVPSLFEGFGLVAAEAMAAGKPVVASDVDGLAEVVAAGETGLLVPPGDAESLAAALVRLLGDARLAEQFGRAGRIRVQEKFSMETYRTNIVEAYRQWT